MTYKMRGCRLACLGQVARRDDRNQISRRVGFGSGWEMMKYISEITLDVMADDRLSWSHMVPRPHSWDKGACKEEEDIRIIHTFL